MISDREIEQIFSTLPTQKDVDRLIADAVQRLYSCPLCNELFRNEKNLSKHIGTKHTDRLKIRGTKFVESSAVKEGAEKIFICPYCGYALSDSGLSSLSSQIYNHVADCPKNIPSENGHRRVSFSYSTDQDLIEKYVNRIAEIGALVCFSCNEAFGTTDALLQHIASEHGHVDKSKVPPEFSKRLRDHAESRAVLEYPGPVHEPVPRKILTPLPPSRTPLTVVKTPPGPTQPKPVREPGKEVPWKGERTVTPDQLAKGTLKLPRLKRHLHAANDVRANLGMDWDKNLPYDSRKGVLSGLAQWYRANAIAVGDKIRMRLLAQTPPRLKIWTQWEKRLDFLLQCTPDDYIWQSCPIRDCIVLVLTELGRPAHYREIYSRISRHRELTPGSVLADLSRYRTILFEHVGWGKWGICEAATTPKKSQSGTHLTQVVKELEADDDVWKAILQIEENDLTYKLLSRIHQELSFNQICQKLAPEFGIEWQRLSATQFLDVEDERLKRLENGSFALAEWFPSPDRKQPSTDTEEVPIVIVGVEGDILQKIWNFLVNLLRVLRRKYWEK